MPDRIPSSRDSSRPVKKKKKKKEVPVKRDDDLDRMFARTRTATKEDEARSGKAPETRIGITKIGTVTDEELEEDGAQAKALPEVPEQAEGKGPTVKDGPEDEVEGWEEDGQVEEDDEGDEAVEREGAGEEGAEEDVPLPSVDEILKKDVEMEEVVVGGDGRKVKILRVKAATPPPLLEEEEEEEGGGDEAEDGVGIREVGERKRPATLVDMGPRPRTAKKVEPVERIGKVEEEEESGDARMGLRQAPREGKDKERTPSKGGKVRRRPGLGIDVELDEEAMRRLAAPVLPQDFTFSARLFHRQLRRHVIMMILPLAMFFFVITRPELTREMALVTIVLVGLMILMIFISMVIYAISPFYSRHKVTEKALFFKQGMYFDCMVPLEDIRSIKLTDRRIAKLGVYNQGATSINVLSNRTGIVEIELDRPLALLGRRAVGKVVLNVDEPGAFVRTVKEAKAFYIGGGTIEAEEREEVDKD